MSYGYTVPVPATLPGGITRIVRVNTNTGHTTWSTVVSGKHRHIPGKLIKNENNYIFVPSKSDDYRFIVSEYSPSKVSFMRPHDAGEYEENQTHLHNLNFDRRRRAENLYGSKVEYNGSQYTIRYTRLAKLEPVGVIKYNNRNVRGRVVDGKFYPL